MWPKDQAIYLFLIVLHKNKKKNYTTELLTKREKRHPHQKKLSYDRKTSISSVYRSPTYRVDSKRVYTILQIPFLFMLWTGNLNFFDIHLIRCEHASKFNIKMPTIIIIFI